MCATVERSSATVFRIDSTGDIDGDLPHQLLLELLVDDSEVIRALVAHAEGDERNHYAAEALKIGVLAMRHVSGQLNTDAFRREGDQFIIGLQKTLDQHKQTVYDQLENKLKEYFDPKDGRFSDRVQR